MTSLKTVSFYHQPDAKEVLTNFLPVCYKDCTASLIRYLPGSVQILEIHSPGALARGSHADENCLCEAIATRVDGSRCLRLAQPCVCPKLFQRPSSTLEYLTMSLTAPDLEPHAPNPDAEISIAAMKCMFVISLPCSAMQVSSRNGCHAFRDSLWWSHTILSNNPPSSGAC